MQVQEAKVTMATSTANSLARRYRGQVRGKSHRWFRLFGTLNIALSVNQSINQSITYARLCVYLPGGYGIICVCLSVCLLTR